MTKAAANRDAHLPCNGIPAILTAAAVVIALDGSTATDVGFAATVGGMISHLPHFCPSTAADHPTASWRGFLASAASVSWLSIVAVPCFMVAVTASGNAISQSTMSYGSIGCLAVALLVAVAFLRGRIVHVRRFWRFSMAPIISLAVIAGVHLGRVSDLGTIGLDRPFLAIMLLGTAGIACAAMHKDRARIFQESLYTAARFDM